LALSACGGEPAPAGDAATGAAAPVTATVASAPARSGSVTPGASGIKDGVLLGKWITADGGSGYDFKDDFSVVITMVGSEIRSSYNIVEGGDGQGKVEIGEQSGVIVWTYKIDGARMDLTADGGRAKKLTKTQ
jgi:hypothetical protein